MRHLSRSLAAPAAFALMVGLHAAPAVAGDKPAAKPGKSAPAKSPPAKSPPAAPPAKGAPVAGAAPKAAPPVAADPARDAADKMQKFYEATKDLHARFEQELSSPATGSRKASGEVSLKKPGRMRWEYLKPDKKLMVADGKTLWVYAPEDEQAYRHDLKSSSLPSSVAFLFGEGRLGDEFEISLGTPDAAHKPAEGDVLLRLVPKKPTAQYHHLEFVVDGKSYVVKETVVYDQQGGTNRMRFLDIKTNVGIADGKFSFSPPPGTRIVKP